MPESHLTAEPGHTPGDDDSAGLRRPCDEWQVFLDGMPDVLMLVDRQQLALWMNRAARYKLRRPAEGALMPLPCWLPWFDHSHDFDGSAIERAFATGNQQEDLFEDGCGQTWGLKVFPPLSASGGPDTAVVMASDITDKINLRAEALRCGQMNMLEQLAAGVAHEINNPINGIINYAQLIADRCSPGSDLHAMAGEIIDEGTRVAGIASNLLALARDQRDQRQPVAPAEIFRSGLALAHSRMVRDGINADIDVSADLPDLLVQKEQMQQLVLNLLSNARHALNQKFGDDPTAKRLVVRAQQVSVKERPYVRFEILDNGTGIEKESLEKIFDPFYTVRLHEKRTGLGLSVSKGIVTNHGGRIRITSEAGIYTRVTFDLPVPVGMENIT